MTIDLLIYSAAQVVTCANLNGPGPKRGRGMADAGVLMDGAVAVDAGRIVAVGTSDELRPHFDARQQIDATGKVVCPGLVDPHTHVLYAGNRLDEFELRLRGATYMEIMRAGGGIRSTVTATRRATLDALVAVTAARLRTMLRLGTTTVEIKSGYGLDTATELKMLRAIERLDAQEAVELIPTFIGAHAVPPEYEGRTDAYVDLVIDEMLPAVAEWYAASHFKARSVPLFADVFCEEGVFSAEQTRRIFAAARDSGMALKLHADEFVTLGGVPLAVEMGAASVDHLDATPPGDVAALAGGDTVGVVLPAVNFNLGSSHYADARGLIDSGAALALATDANPGSAPCLSLPLVMAIACRYQRLTPAEALIASTLNAAYAVGMGDTLGSLEAGKQADLLVLDTSDYRDLAYRFGENLVLSVLKRGQVV